MPVAIGSAIGLFLFNIGADIALASFFVSSVGTALIGIGLNLAISVGGSYLIGTLTRGQSTTPTPSDGQTQIKQPLAPRIKSYGRVRVAGPLWWMDTDGLTPATLFLGFAVNHGRIGSIVSYHIDENEVDIDVNDKVTTLPYATYDVYLHSRLGNFPETAYTQLDTTFGLENARGDGVATVLASIKNPATVDLFTTVYPNGRPLIRVTIEASVVWDPRDASQSREDPLTWEYSDNVALCLLDYLLSTDGFGMPWTSISPAIDDWILAADICDEEVEVAGGSTVRRYVCAFSYRLTDDPKDVVARFLSTCDGRLFPRRDGAISFTVGKFVAPTITLDDDAIVDYQDMTFGQDTLTSLIGIRGQYMSPDHDYREHEAEPWPSAMAVLEAGEERAPQLDLLGVPSNSQARRLMKRTYIRAYADWTGTVTTNLRGLRAIEERYITLQIAELGIDRTFEINRFSFDRNTRTCQLSVRSVDETIDDWDGSSEEGVESGVFGFSGSYSKVGTTVDPILEAGGLAAQTAVVFACSVSLLAATPAGWTQVINTGTNPNLGVWWKKLDGTETTTTFLAGSGHLEVVFLNVAPNPGTLQAESIMVAGSGTDIQRKLVEPLPYAVFYVSAGNADITNVDYCNLVDDVAKLTYTPEQLFIMHDAVSSMHIKMVIFSIGEVAEILDASTQNFAGRNALASFTLQPG